MNWTTQRPTTSGYYFLQQEGDQDPPAIVQVRLPSFGPTGCDGDVYLFMVKEPILLSSLDGSRWCGPVRTPPKEILGDAFGSSELRSRIVENACGSSYSLQFGSLESCVVANPKEDK